MVIKAYKGFNADMTCRGFQFKEGETYTEEKAELCNSGFHACEDPIDCLGYYSPADNAVFHEVELDEVSAERENDTKICGKKIKIGAAVKIGEMINASVRLLLEKTKNSTNTSSGYGSTAASSGNGSKAVSSGNYSKAASSGNYSKAASSGDNSTAASSGNYSKAASSGDNSTAASSGNYSTAASSGNGSTAASSGNGSKASAIGKNSIAAAIGRNTHVKGDIGSWIIATEYGDWDGECYPVVGVVSAKIDGEILKPNTWYITKGRRFVKAEE
jgi:hypothetical protein